MKVVRLWPADIGLHEWDLSWKALCKSLGYAEPQESLLLNPLMESRAGK